MWQARFNVKVECYFTELEILLPSNAIGRDLMEQVVEKLALKEVWFFGLEFKDPKNCSEWLKLKKKVLNILIISRDCCKSFCFAGFHARCRQTETSAVNVETEVLSRKRRKRIERQHHEGSNTFWYLEMCLRTMFCLLPVRKSSLSIWRPRLFRGSWCAVLTRQFFLRHSRFRRNMATTTLYSTQKVFLRTKKFFQISKFPNIKYYFRRTRWKGGSHKKLRLNPL